MEEKIQELEQKLNECRILIEDARKLREKKITQSEIDLLPKEKIKQILKLFPETYLELQDKEKYLSYLLELNPENIQYIENQEETIIKYNLIEKYNRSSLIKFIRNPSKEIMNKIIFDQNIETDYIPFPEELNRSEIERIIRKNGFCINLFPQDSELKWLALNYNIGTICNIENPTQEMKNFVFETDIESIFYIPDPSEEMKMSYIDFHFQRDPNKIKQYIREILEKFGNFTEIYEIKLIRKYPTAIECINSPCDESIITFLEEHGKKFIRHGNEIPLNPPGRAGALRPLKLMKESVNKRDDLITILKKFNISYKVKMEIIKFLAEN